MKFLVMLILAAQALACHQTEKNKAEAQNKETAVVVEHPLPDLKRVDSIDANFFPNVEDQKVYTRISTVNKTLIDRIMNIDVRAAKIYSVPCEYDTKFFCYAKGEIVKTLYLATQKDSCRFVGYINNGLTVRTVLSDSSAQMVKQLKQKSRKP